MREVVIVGGGLSGLSAAYELEKLHVPYTLIEVKKRFGGSIVSEKRAGFIMDGGTLFVERSEDWSILPELGLSLTPVDDKRAVFPEGTQSLIDALAKRMTNPAMMRMAVSSLGQIELGSKKVFGVCLENGIMLDARALIVATPARYAEKMLRELQGEIAFRLLDFRYEAIARVSLCYHRESVGVFRETPQRWLNEYPISRIHYVEAAGRVPHGGVLIQAEVRFDPTRGLPNDLAGALAALMRWSPHPLAERVDYWAEADLIRDDKHAEHIAAIAHLTPPAVALINSDYLPDDRLSVRFQEGRIAARRIATFLGYE